MASRTKKVKTIKLELTAQELVHLRDLFSIVLPPDGERTISSCLATMTKRQVKEGILWKKIVNACKENEIPVGSEAPDFFVNISAPIIDIFRANDDDELEDVILE